jgi:CheY-like chemotaxis protein
VLIVEDDATSARRLAQLLREDGYAAEIALDGKLATERLARAPQPDVLIVDYRLPGVDGLGVVRFAREHTPTMRVLMVTSYPEVIADRLRAEHPGAVLVPKPVRYERLLEHLAV